MAHRSKKRGLGGAVPLASARAVRAGGQNVRA